MKKQLLSLVLMMLPLLASADAIEIDGIYYNLYLNGTVVTSNPNKYTGNIVIPETINYNDVTYSVTRIDDGAFKDCSGLTSITIPNSVTGIGYYAFEGCTGLTSITIPNSVKSMGQYAFYRCSGLTSVTIGNSVTSIGNDAFSHCSSLISITIPNSVTSIGDHAFYGCSSLTSVTIPNSVTSIGKNAFSGCRLQNVVAKNSMTDVSNVFSQGTFNHAILYIPVGKRWDFVYNASWYLFANMKEMVAEANEINEQNAYMLMNAKSFEYMVYDEVNNEVRSVDSFYNVDENVASNNWQFVNVDGKKCLYNIKAKKYASISQSGKIQLQSLPIPLNMTNGNSGIVVNGNDEIQYNFVVNDLMAIDQNPTGIQTLTTEKINHTHYYDLNGRKHIGEPTKKGIYINNGQKVIVK